MKSFPITRIIDISQIKNNCHKENENINMYIISNLYRIFSELAIEYFDNNKIQDLCYDQLCIMIDGIDENLCRVKLMKTLTCTIFENGLCDMDYTTYFN
jgi:hypothetical protein